MLIRKPTEGDISQIADIYNYEVLGGYATFDINPKTEKEMLVWLNEHNTSNHPIIVACEGDIILGYASLSQYRSKEAYAATTELSVYVSPSARGRGVATALLNEILSIARNNKDIHTVISVITSGNDVSVHLHEKFGFHFCGKMAEVGIKNGRLLDILNFQLMV